MPNDPQLLERRERRRVFERRLQTTLLTGLMLLLAWMARTVAAVDKRTAVIDERVASSDILRSRESARDRAESSARYESLERRIALLERRRAQTQDGAPWQ